MKAQIPEEISQLLMAWNEGNEAAIKNLVSIVYPELRRIARRHLACMPPDQTLESAALVNEAYLKLVRALGPNLGAINRVAIISANYVVVPLAPDLFSLQGLRNLGPTLRDWRSE
jgi:hypothetical protein